ncbi:hypothetical protein [Tenacibaculum sp. M341]|uniref:hypothetical protein n=1 Tax=Tenacibaculum sp. M341 TaxID=2530339 RepID=UPI001053ACF6|nr:hypothetical protein [Tenacibaculum sp. M341]TCI94406.1 hypothetical protein EYW44_03410 [Tenacibaculum sp. M341]
MQKTLWYIFIIIIFIRCTVKNTSDIYVGGYRVLDEVIPYPYIIKKSNDSVMLYNTKGKLLDAKKLDSITKKDTLKIHNKAYLINSKKSDYLEVFDLSDTINFPRFRNEEKSPAVYNFCAYFFKTEKTKQTLNLSKVEKLLKTKVWKYTFKADENYNPNEDLDIEKYLLFENEKAIELTNYYFNNEKITSQHREYVYKLSKIDNRIFLSFIKTDKNPQPIFQVTAVTNSEITLRDFSSAKYKGKTIKLSATTKNDTDFSDLISRSTYFENCFDGFQGQYYHESITYNKGNEFILNYVVKDIPEITNEPDGYVIVHFNINCKKEIGNLGLIQMDTDYQKTTFSVDLIKHIIHKITTLKDWPNTEDSINKSYKDVHAFLMFKIENNKITDLCP